MNRESPTGCSEEPTSVTAAGECVGCGLCLGLLGFRFRSYHLPFDLVNLFSVCEVLFHDL